MPVDPHALLARSFAPVTQDYAARDTILYALGVGLAHDPLDPQALRFLVEDRLLALPSMVNVLGTPGFWMRAPDTGVDWRRVVHAEQSFTLHRPLPPAGRVVGRMRLDAFHDKGASVGALIHTRRTLEDAATGETLATVSHLTMARGDGGTGVTLGTLRPLPPVPDRAPDLVCSLPTRPEAALIYRLSGDLNPLHADPAVAAAAGFPRPILHGLASMGVACHAVLRAALGWECGRVAGMAVRFSAPVLPGETLDTEMWNEPGAVAFRSRVAGRTVLDRGRVTLSG
jgi:acyl dehydratase